MITRAASNMLIQAAEMIEDYANLTKATGTSLGVWTRQSAHEYWREMQRIAHELRALAAG